MLVFYQSVPLRLQCFREESARGSCAGMFCVEGKRMMISLETLSASSLASLTGKSITLRTGAGQEVPLELAAVTPLGAPYPGTTREPFSLTFRGAPALRLPQGIYHFQIPELGELEFFISQTADGPAGSWFEAIFS